MTVIEAKKDLYNGGRCFTKGKTYTVSKHAKNQSELMDARAINDLKEPHVIGTFYRHFKIIK